MISCPSPIEGWSWRIERSLDLDSSKLLLTLLKSFLPAGGKRLIDPKNWKRRKIVTRKIQQYWYLYDVSNRCIDISFDETHICRSSSIGYSDKVVCSNWTELFQLNRRKGINWSYIKMWEQSSKNATKEGIYKIQGR